MTSTRVHAGVPAGGQFAATGRSEATITLTPTPAQPASPGFPHVVRVGGYAVVPYGEPLPDEGPFTAPTGDIHDFDPAARRTLLAELAAPRPGHGAKFAGVKYTGKFRSSSDIAKSLRADVKAAQQSGALPAGVRFSVTSSTYSGGQSVHVEVLDLPDRDTQIVSDRGNYVGHHLSEPAAQLQNTLRAMMDAYQRDNSDSQSDYFDVQFYGGATIQTESSRDFHEFDRLTKAARKQLNAGTLTQAGRAEFLAQKSIYNARAAIRRQRGEAAEAAVRRAIA